MEVGKKDLEMEPHDIAKIPVASLWELCRSFDEDNGEYPDVAFPGLSMYKHFVELTKIRKVSNPIVLSDEVSFEIVWRRNKEDAYCTFLELSI